ncbi:hypothetical protein GKQ38_00780 [Candidatus Nanohaloarchaea archaeon]|nr:hypothetical protein GKQ38_00780 [Candidatus Nanohaloarchaea archaeon]
MNISSRLKNLELSIFTKVLIIFALIEGLLYIGAKYFPEVIPPVLAIYLAVFLVVLSLSSALVQLNLSIFDIYHDFTEETLKYAKSIVAGVAGGIIVSTSSSYEIGSLGTTGELLGEFLALLIRVIMILLVLLAGLVGFILVEKNHQEVSK